VRIDGDGEGEILVAGPSVAQGYWRQAPFGAWLRTGDLGFVAPDGDLVVTGRVKDLIIVGGANHYPQDLEATACDAHPALRAAGAAAFTVPAPGTVDGVAVVVMAEADRNAEARGEAARAIRLAVAATHDLALADVVLIDAGQLPRTSSGKVRRSAARDAYQGR
jgi:acyl-CoA synthetase (AMP-forming)/AMP-acid ligase II